MCTVLQGLQREDQLRLKGILLWCEWGHEAKRGQTPASSSPEAVKTVRCRPSLPRWTGTGPGPTVCSPTVQANGLLRIERLSDPSSSPFLYSWLAKPSPASPIPAPGLSFPDSTETSDVGRGKHPSNGTLCPSHPHPGPTNGCPGLHACHFQSALSDQR